MNTKPPLPEKHKTKLYPAVLDLFSKHDFHNVNIVAISAASKVSIGTIYKYFESKEDLLFRILSEEILKVNDLAKLHVSGLKSSKEIFRKQLWAVMDYYDKCPGLAVTAFITVPMRTWMQEDTYRVDRRSNWATYVDAGHARGDLDPAVDVRRARDFFYMICYRVIHQWYYHGMNALLVDLVDRDFEILWKLMAPPDKENK